ncbi:hypothetical protein [Haliangium sp.]|uniref:hypothetical protein n=1 Tax=Haliangium sp. TaxID=2663208 RepID=UPI003D0ED14A
MRYLYGDATPFPLEDNFIETLSAATDTCVALFQIDSELIDRRERSQAIRERTAEEIAYLERLARIVDSALAPMIPAEQPTYVAQRTAGAIARSAQAAITQARDGLVRDSESNIRGTIGSDLAGRIQKALASFLLKHQLPKSTWEFRWSYDWDTAQVELTLASSAECGVVAEYTGTLPSDERWSIPQRISDIDPHTELTIQRDVGWLSRMFKGSHESLSGFFITHVEIQGKEARFRVHRSLKPGADGYEIRVRGAAQSAPVVRSLTDDAAEPISVFGEDAANLTSLWSMIATEFKRLTSCRDRLLRARLRGTDVAQIEEPGELPEVILMALAPFVREMRLRSRVPGELVLKRDLGNGRREELFVPRQELERKFATLSSDQQRFFQAAGLGGEATMDFVHRAYPAAPSAPSSPAAGKAKRPPKEPKDPPDGTPESVSGVAA